MPNEASTNRETDFAKFLFAALFLNLLRAAIPTHHIKAILCGQLREQPLVSPNFRCHSDVVWVLFLIKEIALSTLNTMD